MGAVLVVMTAPIIFGGITRVAKIAETFVPVMALLYILVALYIVGVNIDKIPSVV